MRSHDQYSDNSSEDGYSEEPKDQSTPYGGYSSGESGSYSDSQDSASSASYSGHGADDSQGSEDKSQDNGAHPYSSSFSSEEYSQSAGEQRADQAGYGQSDSGRDWYTQQQAGQPRHGQRFGAQPGQPRHGQQFGAQPGQFGQQPGQFGQQPGQFGAQPGQPQFGQQGYAQGGYPGPAGFAPNAGKPAKEGGFFQDLFDFTFERFVAVRSVASAYRIAIIFGIVVWIGGLLSAISGAVWTVQLFKVALLNGGSLLAGLQILAFLFFGTLLLFLYIIGVRVALEVTVSNVKIAQHTKKIADATAASEGVE